MVCRLRSRKRGVIQNLANIEPPFLEVLPHPLNLFPLSANAPAHREPVGDTVKPIVGISVLRALVEKWEAHAAKVSNDWYNDAGAYEDCADELRTLIKNANIGIDVHTTK